ncbi:hypothetical protein BC831DRAFT_42442 [Entophlyctis helioformis]|nr:hypothetical protein BC831DRAFT_42442 [Entophlyctis helioformis]
MGVDKRPTSKSGAAKPPSRSTPVHHDSLSKLYDRLICGVGGVADAAADDNDSDNDSDNDRTTSPRAAPVISPIDAAKLQADVVTMLHRAADHIQSLDPAAESIKTAFDDVVGRCLDMQALIYQTSRSATPPAASVLDDAQLQAAVAAKSATADAAFEELKGVLRSTLENQGQTITACNSFLASLGQDASDFDTATISSIATLSSTVVEFVDMIRKAPKKTDGSSVKAVTRFLATNGLEVASTVISAAKAASQFVPIPGIAVAIGIIDSILSNIKDGMDSIGGLKSFLADLKELKTILAPMANQWFSADVRGKCAELVDLLEDVQDTVILTTRPGRNWLMLVMGSKKAEVEAQIAEFRARLAKIKELISLAMQVDSAVMLMHTAKKLNLIDTKTDKILGLIRPRTLHIRHDDFLVSTAPEDSKGVFLVYKAKMDGSDYVIKEFKKELDEKVREDFLTETRKWFQLSHANLLPITGICLKTPKGSTHRPFIAMPFMEYNLETYLAKYPDLSTQDRLRIISRVARGIKYLHVYAPGAPVLHGSITMRRILLDAKGNKVKIGVGIQSIRALAGPQQATKCMAPEAAVKDYSPKPSLDIYAFAVIAMAVLTRSTIQDLDIETAERPEDVSNELWQCLVKCLGFFKYRPHFDEIVNVLASAVSPINADGGTKLTDGASDLEVLCSIFPDWAKDSEITANAEHLPTGEMLHMYDRLAKRNIPKWRIEWDDTYNLVALRLTGCGLSGAIPKDIGLLTQLRELWLDQNDFEGMIPMELCKLTKLTSL